MSIDNLPSALQPIVQQGFLEREFRDALEARLGFRDIATKEPFMAGIGETITKTRPGLLAAITVPMAAAANSDITSGLTAQNWGVEQYILGIDQYSAMQQLNVATSAVAIVPQFMKNAKTLGEQSRRSVDLLAQRCLFDSYMGGNTRVIATLGSAGVAVQVDDVRGFFQTLNSVGQVVATSSTNHLTVLVGATSYQLNSVVADGTAPTTIPSWLSNLTFSGSNSNTSTTPNGYSGVLTFNSNVTTTNATSGNQVILSTGPAIFRPSSATGNIVTDLTSTSYLDMDTINRARATLENNNVPTLPDGTYHLYLDSVQLTGLYKDTEFQSFTRGRLDTPEYRKGVIAEMLGVKLIRTNLNPVQAINSIGNVRRAVMVGAEALIEAAFTNTAYNEALQNSGGISIVNVVDNIAHITRPQIDVLNQVVTQSWSYIGGFACPTDALTTPTTIPTASNANYKRAAIIESV